MRSLRRLVAVFAVLFAALGAAAAEPPPELPIGEDGCAGARVLDYLERHGDFGQIDPEALLYLSRVEHERRVGAQRQGITADAVAGSVWSSIGPTNGAGRATAVAVHPTIAGTAIIGSAGGGAWKTTDRGLTWTATTETIPNLAVGAIAYAPSDPNRVYLGTGEGGYAADFIPGIGLLTSNDGGATWNLPASVLASMFYRIAVHPANPNELVVGTNRGALRSTSGPAGPWTSVIPSTPGSAPGYGDVSDIVRDPSNSAVLYAATWDRGRWCARGTCPPLQNFEPPTVLKSLDGGVTWASAAVGLPVSTPTSEVERISLAIAPSSPSTLYALTAVFDSSTGVTRSEIYKTTNGGGSWSATALSSSADPRVSGLLGDQGWYDNTIVVAPGDPNIVIAGGVQYARTMDGGVTWKHPFVAQTPHVDVHDLRYDPAGTLWIANDGGIWVSSDHASTAAPRNVNLVTRQYYSMAMDRVNRNRILAGTQDNGTNQRTDLGGTSWGTFSGGDGFHCFVNPDAPGVAYSTFQFAEVQRTKTAGAGVPLVVPSGPVFDPNEKKPFFSVLVADPANASVLYTGSTRVWKSSSGGEEWIPLSTNTAGGGIWNENGVRAIAIAPGAPDTIMVGKGLMIYRTTDGGASWAMAGNGLPGKFVNHIAISPTNPNTAYAAFAGASGSSVYATTDGGNSWIERASGLPSFSALILRFDPTDASTLYAGTDVGVYRSLDRGATWQLFGTGMPAVSVYDVQILRDGSLVRAATHGRGIWELAVTGIVNRRPVVAVTPSLTNIAVGRGTVLKFNGTASDPDGDDLSHTWTFADDWSSKSGAGTASTATHTFSRTGSWPVALAVTDTHGGVGGAEVLVNVFEASDDCATPVVVPAAGPFPWSITLNSEVASTQPTVEPSAGRACYPFQLLRTLWLAFKPEVSGTYTFSLCTSRVPGFIAGYTGPACGVLAPANLCMVNTELSGDCGEDPKSSAFLTAGIQYRFLVGTYYSNTFGPLTVSIHRGATIPAAVRSVSPPAGFAPGGTKVVVTGSGFTAGATVRFGGIPATDVTVINASVLTATVPPHALGDVDVVVQLAGGTVATSARAFRYIEAPPPPTVGRRRGVRH